MTSYISSVCQQRDQPSSQIAEGDSTALFQQRFLQKFRQRPENMWSQQSIYRIPSLLRDLDPNAYEPRVVSIGPYHHGKEQLQAMERHKHRALNRFLSINGGISFDGILAKFRNLVFRKCYTEPLEPQWSDDDVFFQLMVLDGCFLLELLLGNDPIRDPRSSINDHPEKHALLSCVKMDMLILDNQIPLLVLRRLASIANLVSKRPSATLTTGSEGLPIRIDNLNINQLIGKFYCNMNDDIPANDVHHVLDPYREGCIRTRSGAYDGWASSLSVRELYYHGVEFRASSGGAVEASPMGRITDIAFKVSDNNFLTLWWWYIPFGVPKGMFSLPRLTIDGTTRTTLRNLMAYERLHLYSETHPVTNYVLLMGSLIRSGNDVEHLRKESILWCSPGWTNESVVQLFADLTRNVGFNGTRTTNPEMDELCERPPNKFWSVWRRLISPESSDAKALCLLFLTVYGLLFTIFNSSVTFAKIF